MLLCRLSFEVRAYSSSAFRSQSNRTRFIRLRRIRIRHHPTPNVPRAGPQTHHGNHLTSIFKRNRSVNHRYKTSSTASLEPLASAASSYFVFQSHTGVIGPHVSFASYTLPLFHTYASLVAVIASVAGCRHVNASVSKPDACDVFLVSLFLTFPFPKSTRPQGRS